MHPHSIIPKWLQAKDFEDFMEFNDLKVISKEKNQINAKIGYNRNEILKRKLSSNKDEFDLLRRKTAKIYEDKNKLYRNILINKNKRKKEWLELKLTNLPKNQWILFENY